ncbi:MAG: hypothetical protein FJ104_02745 [Deltaproteobacteria bacterium]|nr:hypothetical protein [Deltaproteobacteria bacterium]
MTPRAFPFALGRILLAPLLLAACGSGGDDEGGDTGGGAPADVIDARATPPAATDADVDFLSEELTIPVGEDKQMCVFMKSPDRDIYVQKVEQIQGDGGHHALLLATGRTDPPGTIVDCTDAERMADFKLQLLPLELPDGYAQLLPANTAMVMQSHYINTNDLPLLVKDTVRLHTVPGDTVATPAAPFATNTYDFSLPPLARHEKAFDCTVDRDTEIITVGGHMHEEGKSFKLELVHADGSVEVVHEVPAWVPSYRDTPPIDSFPSKPVAVKKGETIRTTCVWQSTRDEEVGWPSEMCASFGLTKGAFEPYQCAHGEP